VLLQQPLLYHHHYHHHVTHSSHSMYQLLLYVRKYVTFRAIATSPSAPRPTGAEEEGTVVVCMVIMHTCCQHCCGSPWGLAVVIAFGLLMQMWFCLQHCMHWHCSYGLPPSIADYLVHAWNHIGQCFLPAANAGRARTAVMGYPSLGCALAGFAHADTLAA
jgi:hypothetical protein